MSADDELAEMFKKAAAIAAVVPEAMQEAAFHRALDALQNEGGRRTPAARPQSRQGHKPTGHQSSQQDDPVARIQQLARTDAADVDAQSGALGKSLALLRVAERELDIQRLSAPQIASVLTDKFRWKVTRRGVSKALDEAGRLVDRRKEGGAVSYRLMAPGEEWLDGSASGSDRETRGQRRKPASAGTKKKAASSRKTATASKSAKATSGATAKVTSSAPRRSGRAGPKEAVEGLIAGGFFGSPRTISDIRLVLEQQRALRYKATDLSPTLVRLLRDAQLTRSKNDDGQYEYLAPGA